MKFILRSFYILFILFFYGNTTLATAAPDVWDVLRPHFVLDHAIVQPEVQSQLRWLIAHPSYIRQLAQAEPYIYHIVTEIKKRHLPGELALIPFIESTYDPFAYSGVGAAGLWQLMPGTGTELGLKRDWWFDGRRSIRPSTDAALNYLQYLHKFFRGNWILAIAAYDSGEGTVSRAIKRSRQTSGQISFWKLPVPSETKAYVPRLLALAELLKYPERYHVRLPKIPHVPYFEEVNIGSQIDLNHAAKLAGISYKDLIKLNPGFNRWATAPYKPFKLLIPANKVQKFNQNLAHVPQEKRVSWTRHQVKKGERIESIAQRYYTTPKLILELNQLHSSRLKQGQSILIPSTKNAPKAIKRTEAKKWEQTKNTLKQVKVIHIVQPRETFASIQKKYKISKEEVIRWNRLSHHKELVQGMTLMIWKRSNG